MIQKRDGVRVGSEGCVGLASLAKATSIEADHREVLGEGGSSHRRSPIPAWSKSTGGPLPSTSYAISGAVHRGDAVLPLRSCHGVHLPHDIVSRMLEGCHLPRCDVARTSIRLRTKLQITRMPEARLSRLRHCDASS